MGSLFYCRYPNRENRRYNMEALYSITQNSRSMRCHVEDVCRRMLIFSRKVLKDRGKADYSSLFVENSHPETRPQGVMFHPPWAFVRFTTALRYEPCTQFINVSQRALHIYFIDGCRRIKIERNNLLCEQAPTEVFRSIFAWLVTLNLKNYFYRRAFSRFTLQL